MRTFNTSAGIKLELFIFDVFPFTERVAVLESVRADEFAPLKNASGPDSPDTSRAAVLAQHVRFAVAAGATVNGTELELSPLVTYAGEGLDGLRGRTISTPMHVESLAQLNALQ